MLDSQAARPHSALSIGVPAIRAELAAELSSRRLKKRLITVGFTSGIFLKRDTISAGLQLAAHRDRDDKQFMFAGRSQMMRPWGEDSQLTASCEAS